MKNKFLLVGAVATALGACGPSLTHINPNTRSDPRWREVAPPQRPAVDGPIQPPSAAPQYPPAMSPPVRAN